jgi:arsenate reductase
VAQLQKTHVLFVCIGNACRSPMGEAIARKEGADVMEASSAGLYPLGVIPQMTRKTLEANGYSVEGLESKGLREFSADEVNLVVNLSGMSRPAALADFESVEEWEVADPFGGDVATYQEILQEIQSRVREMAQRLRDQQRAEGGRE